MNGRTRSVSWLLTIVALMVIGGAPDVAEARITKLVIDAAKSESPTFGGYSWPGVGRYEKIVGVAYGEVDPSTEQNSVIVDIGFVPPNGRATVEYSFDFYILKPKDLSKGAHKVMYEPPNRGRKTWQSLGRVTSGGNDPGSITDPTELANAFLMPRGYTMVWSGWDASAGTSSANFNTRIGGAGGPGAGLPIAKHLDGSTITGPAFEYIVISGTSPYTLTYPAATPDKGKATLTHRVHLNDPPVPIPASGWTYNATGTTINLVPAGRLAHHIY